MTLGDGGLGTLLHSLGLPPGEAPERWLLERPDQVQAAHAAFREAGAQWLQANTFGATALRLAASGLASHDAADVATLNRIAVRCARAAAGDLPVLGSLGPTGAADPKVWVEAYTQQAEALAAAGVSGLLVETIVRLDEGLAALAAARAAGVPQLWASFTPGPDGCLLDGTDPEAAAHAFVRAGAVVIGANCGTGQESLVEPVRRLLAADLAPVLAMPSAGLPVDSPSGPSFPVNPDAFAEAAIQFRNMGVRYFAGCCGVGPAHLRAAAARLAPAAPGE